MNDVDGPQRILSALCTGERERGSEWGREGGGGGTGTPKRARAHTHTTHTQTHNTQTHTHTADIYVAFSRSNGAVTQVEILKRLPGMSLLLRFITAISVVHLLFVFLKFWKEILTRRFSTSGLLLLCADFALGWLYFERWLFEIVLELYPEMLAALSINCFFWTFILHPL